MIIREMELKYKTGINAKELKKIQSPQDVSKYLETILDGAIKEYFIVLNMNNRGKIQGYYIASIGSQNETIVNISEIFKTAILSGAMRIIIVHNHPSGHREPSKEDLAITERIKKAGELLCIELLDHIIITDENAYSFKQENLL